jgi:integrase/recombinase XerD
MTSSQNSRHETSLIESLGHIDEFLHAIKVERNAKENTLSSYCRDLEAFAEYLDQKEKDSKFSKLSDKEKLQLYRDAIAKDFKASTISRKISALRQFFDFLITEKIVKKNPAIDLSFPKKQAKLPKFLTIEEIERVREVLAKKTDIDSLRFKLIFEILVGSGLRVSEIISLKLNNFQSRNINGKQHNLLIVKGKGGKERIAPLSKKASEYLELYKKHINYNSDNQNMWLFPSRKNQDKHITRQQLANILKQYGVSAGLDPNKISPHILRHSFATNALEKNIDLRMLQEVLGHSDISTTQIYTHTNSIKLKKFINEHHPMAKKNK